MVSQAERTAVLVRGIEASVAGDSSVIADLYTTDVTAWSPSMSVSSAAELAGEFEDRAGAFTDIELEVVPLDVGGEQACAEWVATVTHSGPLAVDDDVVVQPTGVRYSLHGVTVAEFAGDRIRSFRQYWDEAEVLAQIGLLTDD